MRRAPAADRVAALQGRWGPEAALGRRRKAELDPAMVRQPG
jgi:hypothetical protein